MTTFIRVVVGILVIAHGLVHLLYLISEPKDPKFPFTLGRSWLRRRSRCSSRSGMPSWSPESSSTSD